MRAFLWPSPSKGPIATILKWRATLEKLEIERPRPTQDRPQGLCLDKGDDYDEVRALLAEFDFAAHIRARGEEAKAIKHEAGFRARRWEEKAENHLAFLHLACITFQQIGLLG